jgi:hypothetical protein
MFPIIGKSQNLALADTTKTSSNTLELTTGLSIPFGYYARIDIHDVYSNISGLAGIGLNINATYKHCFSRYLGLEIKAYYCSNKFKADEIYNYNHYVKDGGSYKAFGLLLGPSTVIKISHKWSVEQHLLMGYAILQEPEITFGHFAHSGTDQPDKLSKINAYSFLYNIGIGFIRRLNDKLCFTANVDYLEGTFKFDKYSYSTISVERGKQNYGVLNINVGLRLNL